MLRPRLSRSDGWGLLLALVVSLILIVLNTDFQAPPRYDGAGYSVLAESLRTGRGYRSIDHPDAPLHTHFPPAYPMLLAGLWSVFGRSVPAAHVLSVVCTVGAVGLTILWYRRLESRRVTFLLALSLAVNWTWGRVGGSIQSEPLFLLLGQMSILLASKRKPAIPLPRAGAVGALLGLAILTRHVGVCLAGAILIEMAIRRDWKSIGMASVALLLVVSPWAWWLASSQKTTQAALFESTGLVERIGGQALFYLRRIPDQIAGPFVESATVFGRSRLVSVIATVAASVASAGLLLGWFRALRSRRRRLVGLIPLTTLPLLLVWPFTEAGRFLIPLVPVLLLGGVEALSGLRGGWRPDRTRGFAAVLLLLVSLPYPIYSLTTSRAEAQRRSQADFDLACSWINQNGMQPGSILTRHPGEAYWHTGRTALAPESDQDSLVEQQMQHAAIAYLIIDDDRFANAPTSPLGRFVAGHPDKVRLCRDGATRVYELIRP